jgi:hypothetical protein
VPRADVAARLVAVRLVAEARLLGVGGLGHVPARVCDPLIHAAPLRQIVAVRLPIDRARP